MQNRKADSEGKIFIEMGEEARDEDGIDVECAFDALDYFALSTVHRHSTAKGNAHGGGVFGLAWSTDGTKIATASEDDAVKIWNVATKTLEKIITFGSTADDQQLAVVWTEHSLVSISLRGYVHFIAPALGRVFKSVRAHIKSVNAMALSQDKLFICIIDSEGNITRTNLASGESLQLASFAHKKQITGLCLTAGGSLISAATDGSLQAVEGTVALGASARSTSTNLSSHRLNVGASSDDDVAFIACQKAISIFHGGKHVGDHPLHFSATCISYSAAKKLVAVGGQDGKVYIFFASGATISQIKEVDHNAPITAIAFSDDGSHLTATDSARKVIPYAVDKDFAIASDKEWTFHASRVNCVAWAPNGRYLAAGLLDQSIIVWDMQKSGEHPIILNNGSSQDESMPLHTPQSVRTAMKGRVKDLVRKLSGSADMNNNVREEGSKTTVSRSHVAMIRQAITCSSTSATSMDKQSLVLPVSNGSVKLLANRYTVQECAAKREMLTHNVSRKAVSGSSVLRPVWLSWPLGRRG